MTRLPAVLGRTLLVSAVIAVALGGSVPLAAAQGGTTAQSGEVRLAAAVPASSGPHGAAAKKKACAGLRGNKLRRCKAVARCKRFKGKRKRRCLARARKIGAKQKQSPPQQSPPKAEPPPVAQPKPVPGPGPTPQPANQAPRWPSPFRSQLSTSFQYDPTTGFLIGATTTITVLSRAIDPDGDPLTYTWSASNGSISGDGLSATWTRVIAFGQPASGTATVTASDGRGGTAPFEFRFL